MSDELFDQSEGVRALKAFQATLNPPTQRELANRLECSEGTISDLYGGKRAGIVLATYIELETDEAIRVELFGFLPTDVQLERREWSDKKNPSSKRKSR